MHIAEGVLPGWMLCAGAGLTAGGTWLGLRAMEEERLPQTALLSAAFFVASLIHVPLGPTSVHLLLNGLNGIVLGWIAFPSLLVALFLQALLFQFGGITTLGVNTFNMAFPGVVAWLLFGGMARRGGRGLVALAGVLTAVLGVGLGALLVAGELALTARGFLPVARLALVAHLPVMGIEAVLTAATLSFLRRVRPEVLEV